MKGKIKPILSWLIAAWICKVFIASIPYKFSAHPDTLHIFGTIGNWLAGFFGHATGSFFSNYGSYIVGSFELLTSIVLLLPALLWLTAKLNLTTNPDRARFHRAGGLSASAVMAGAVFFHLFSPLGVKVLHEGKSDGGSLFYAAVSIMILGIVLFLLNNKN